MGAHFDRFADMERSLFGCACHSCCGGRIERGLGPEGYHDLDLKSTVGHRLASRGGPAHRSPFTIHSWYPLESPCEPEAGCQRENRNYVHTEGALSPMGPR